MYVYTHTNMHVRNQAYMHTHATDVRAFRYFLIKKHFIYYEICVVI